MTQCVQHQILLVGVEPRLVDSIRQALQLRSAEPTHQVATVAEARKHALAHVGDSYLFIVQLTADEDLTQLRKLTESVPGQPVLVLLGSSDFSRLLAVQRCGAAQIVPLPWQQDDFLQAIDCLAVQFAPALRDARVLAISGVSGGAGATTLALNLAFELLNSTTSSPRPSILLVELARQMGTLATYLNIEPRITVHQLLSDPSRLTLSSIRAAMTTVAPGLDVLTGPYLDITPGSVSPRHVFQLIELCRKMASIVILDVPCVFDDLQFETLALADQVVLVGVQTVSSVRTLKLVRETLERDEGIRDTQLVINRYEPTMHGFSARRLAELLQVPQVFTIANDYPSVMAALNHGKPLRVASPHSPVLADIRTLARSLKGGRPTPPSDQGDRLLRTLSRSAQGIQLPREIRVLHVEDDPIQQSAMALYLAAIKTFRSIVSTASSEEKAVKLFSQQPFEVVLLDYHLEQGNGLQCLRQLRSRNRFVPIVVVSGLDEPRIAAELLDAGADDFLSKENLTAQRLSQCLSDAIARADACKERGTTEQDLERLVDRVRTALPNNADSELLQSIRELHLAGSGRFSVGQIQRLVDQICAELAPTKKGEALPRRAMLTLFLRLFGASDTTE